MVINMIIMLVLAVTCCSKAFYIEKVDTLSTVNEPPTSETVTNDSKINNTNNEVIVDESESA